MAALCRRRAGASLASLSWLDRTRRCCSSYVPLKMEGREVSVPVLIVGAGPVGLVLSILLAKLGIQSLTIDKKMSLSQHPQAHFINNRTMEIFRKIGTLHEEIKSLQPPIEQWRNFVYCTSLTGPLLGVVGHLHPEDLERKLSPTWVGHFSQHRLIPLICKQAEELGVQINNDSIYGQQINSLGELKLGHECVSLYENEESVKAEVLVTGSTKEKQLTINSSFVVGADGAASNVRRLINVEMEGEDALQNLISIHFFSIDLAQRLVKSRPGMLYFVFNTKAIGVLVAHDLRLGEFIVQVPFFPPQQSYEDFTDHVCKDILFSLAGVELFDVDIKTVKQWVMDAKVASRYLSSNQRVILAGDAAHRFPPAGGFGMNTGIQDAHNLAWKLAAILNGVSPKCLLNTYETERQPIAKANTALSIKNFKAATSIPSVLGLNPSSASFIHKQLNKGIGSLLPRKLQKNLLENIFAVGRTQVSPLFLNEYNPLGSSRLQKLKRLLNEGRSLQLQFPAEDLGFRYRVGALLNAKDEEPKEHLATGSTKRDYEQVCKPGFRLPHLTIRILDGDLQKTSKDVISTLDLNKGDNLELFAFVGPNASGCLWGDLLFLVARDYQVKVKLVMIWPLELRSNKQRLDDARVITEWAHSKQGSVLHVEVTDTDWWEFCGIPSVGAILVRPDDHIAWVSHDESTSASIKELHKVFDAVFRGLAE